MEFISARAFEYVTPQAQNLIKYLLESWYRPKLSHPIRVEDMLVKRRFMDWSFRNLYVNYRVGPGLLKLPNFTRVPGLIKPGRYGYLKDTNTVVQIPRQIKKIRPFLSNYVLVTDAAGKFSEEGLGP